MNQKAYHSEETRKKFQKQVIRSNQIAHWCFSLGGLTVLASIFGIFIFILVQIFPLFQPASVKKVTQYKVTSKDPVVIGVDEYNQRPFVVDRSGILELFNGQNPADVSSKIDLLQLVGFEGSLEASIFLEDKQELLLGSSTGEFSLVELGFSSEFTENQSRTISVNPNVVLSYQLDADQIIASDTSQSLDRRVLANVVSKGGSRSVYAIEFNRGRTLFGPGDLRLNRVVDLTPWIDLQPVSVKVGSNSSDILVLDDAGNISVLNLSGSEGAQRVQLWVPSPEIIQGKIVDMRWLLGRFSLILTDDLGFQYLASRASDSQGETRYSITTVTGDEISNPDLFSTNLRNRVYLRGNANEVELLYATTLRSRWSHSPDYNVIDTALSPRNDALYLLDDEQWMHQYSIYDPHPEAGFKSFFGKIRYEGQAEAQYTWQSSGATDDFEPKFSLMPLIYGSMKGTFYAIIFSVPIAVLGALYTSQFLADHYKKYIKPLMEIMASLPSVVLGFLGALWLAPIIETRIPSVLLIIVFMPLISMFLGMITYQVNQKFKIRFRGKEFLFLIPLLLFSAYALWQLGPTVERLIFVYQDPVTGERIADFRLWWPENLGIGFDQRNSMVVGFMMGFAIIPLIFTISEDAMSSVPTHLTSASYALGANRWQTAWKIVVPTASAGVLSAVMIGIGRAIGETMIVVMATGNTPVMEWDVFTGMRTLAANLAVELPEAALNSTLYRSLFLGAMVLFLMTFALNTVSDIIRQRLKLKYKSTL